MSNNFRTTCSKCKKTHYGAKGSQCHECFDKWKAAKIAAGTWTKEKPVERKTK